MPPKKRASEGAGPAKQKRRKRKGESSNGASASPEPEDESDNEKSETEIEVAAEEFQDFLLEGSMISGELLYCGATNWDLVGRNQVPKGVKSTGGPNLWGPHTVAALRGVKVRTVVSNAMACHSIIITEEGKALSFGRNDKAQLGHGDTKRRDIPTLIECLQDLNIVDAACGKNHTLCLTEKGTVYSFGENKMGQLGLGNQTASIPSPTKLAYKGPPIRAMACGAEFSMIVDVRGNLYSFGCPEYGQLGHNTDGKYFVASNKMTFNSENKPRRVHVFVEKSREGHISPIPEVEIQDVACGTNHTIVLDRSKRIFTWGFGGYGRLGHADPKDLWVPTMVKFFDGPNRGAKTIAAGSAYTIGVNEYGAIYLWGQNKPTGEANMYPKPVQDLCGWKIRSIGCSNRSILVAADDSLISWGPSPTYGELGYGENKPKSSTTPQEVKTLSNVYIHKVAAGYGHSLFIARNDTDEDKKNIDDLPEFTPQA